MSSERPLCAAMRLLSVWIPAALSHSHRCTDSKTASPELPKSYLKMAVSCGGH